MRRRPVALPAAVALAGAVLVGAGGLSGCAPLVCPAIGWVNGVMIDASAYPEAAHLEFCVEDVCASDLQPGTLVADRDGDRWHLSMDMGTPEAVTVRLLDADRALLHESTEPISRTHDTGPCGGPATAEPILL